MDEFMTVELTLDNDEVVECAILTLFEAGENQYIALLPLNEEGETEEGDVYLYRYIENADGEPEEKDVLVERYVFYPSTYYPTRLGSVAIYGGNPVVMCGQMRKRGMLFGHSIMSARVEYGRCCFLDVRFIP